MTKFFQIVVSGGPSSESAPDYHFAGNPVCDPKKALDELMEYTDEFVKRAWGGNFSTHHPDIYSVASLTEGFLCHICDPDDTTKVQVYEWELYPKNKR